MSAITQPRTVTVMTMYLVGRVFMLLALFVTGRMCILACMTGNVSAVEPGG